MPVNNPNIPAYSAADLLRYATGRMTAPEMHRLEKAALEDPFLAEAMEGYLEAAKMHPQLQTHIDKLTPATTKKEERKPVSVWWKKVFQYAAAAVIILGSAWFTYSLLQNPAKDKQQAIAVATNPTPAPTVVDTARMNTTKSSAPANQVPVVKNEQYGNAETEPNQDFAAKQPTQAPILKNSEPGFFKDTLATEKTDNTNLATNDVAKKELKDESLSGTVSMPATAPNGTSSTYKIADKQRAKPLNKSDSTDYRLSQNVFRGRITDARNNPLPYANVMVSGENIGTYTDTKGNFNITYDDSILPVRTRSLGYESQTVQLKAGNRDQQIIMPEDEKLKENLPFVVQKRQAKQAGLKPLIIETDSLSSAQPVIGLNNYNTYLLNNNRISELPQASRSVELSFEVDKRGEVKNITVEQSSGKELDAEAIRLLKEGPKWKSNNGGTGRARVKVKL